MGQDWLFINIDKHQKLSPPDGVKMGEFFFTDYPPEIIMLLMVPEGEGQTHTQTTTGSNSWAGDRIICIGDHTSDWPPNLLGDDIEPPRSTYTDAIEIFPIHRKAPALRSSGVLRNLSQKKYVRAGGLPVLSKRAGPGLHILKDPPPIDHIPGLGSVLLGRIGWSEDPSSAMCWDKADSLAEGEWAGDRFDVRAFDDVKEELERDGWIDVTEEEAERTISIWKSECEM